VTRCPATRLLSLLAAGILVAGCDDDAAPQPAYGSAPTVALNEPVDVGAFAFTVTDVELSQPEIGNRTAEGTFVVVGITVRNIGDGPRSVYCQNQVLRDLSGRRYENGVTVDGRDDMISVEPATTVNFRCAFDVPVGTLAGAVEVHDTAYAAGATVRVLSAG
jgi:uncharacterized protein DUF4352